MNSVPLVIGGLMAAGGAYLSLVWRKKTEGILTELKFLRTTPLSEIAETWKSLAAEGLNENFREVVKTSGKAETDGELKAPYSETPCAYFEATVTREYETEEISTDKDGKPQRRRTRGSETVSSRKSSSPLYVADENMRVGLDMDGATIHLKDGADRFDPYESNRNYSFFGVQFSAPSGSRTLGFRYKERLIPSGSPLFVVGEIRQSAGAPRIGRPSESGKPFIVSVKSEDEVASSVAGKAKMQLYLGIALMVGGAAVALLLH